MFFHPCWEVSQAAWDPCRYRWIIWSKWEIELCVISIAMVGYTMCLYDGTQWCSVYGEEKGSKNRSLRNPSDQLMCSGFLPSPGHLERPTSEIGFKPAKWNPVMPSDVRVARRIWWLTVSKAAGRSSRMRINDLESAFAIRKASVTESSSVSAEHVWSRGHVVGWLERRSLDTSACVRGQKEKRRVLSMDVVGWRFYMCGAGNWLLT